MGVVGLEAPTAQSIRRFPNRDIVMATNKSRVVDCQPETLRRSEFFYLMLSDLGNMIEGHKAESVLLFSLAREGRSASSVGDKHKKSLPGMRGLGTGFAFSVVVLGRKIEPEGNHAGSSPRAKGPRALRDNNVCCSWPHSRSYRTSLMD